MARSKAHEPDDDRPYILSFVGENANGILKWWTIQILEACAKHGFAYHVIDMMQDSWKTELEARLVQSKPVFCFSFQGFGMNLRLDEENFWTANQIPFLSYVGDNLHHAPKLHAAAGAGLQLLYTCDDFLQSYKAMNGPLYATIFRHGFPQNALADDSAWKDRPHQIVYIKTGVDPAKLRSEWNDLPRSTGRLINACSTEILSGADRTVTDVCISAFEADNQHLGANTEYFLYVCAKVDFYVRATRAERMVRALRQQKALIFGDWSHLDHKNSKARFCASVPADQLDRIYATSQIVINTSPTVRYGMHERIMAGLLAKAVVVSDETPFLKRFLEPCPSFKTVSIDDEWLPQQLDLTLTETLADPEMPDKITVSSEFARNEFSLERFALGLFDQVNLELHRRNVAGWCFRPSPR